ncbi:MAG: hypothetical protein ACTMHH_06410 [Nesterenkonia sp.]
MVIHTERTRDEERVISALRAVFDASVMNFGSYNLLYARNMVEEGTQDDDEAGGRADAGEAEVSVLQAVAGSQDLLIGYRREPVELVLCPLDTDQVLNRLGQYDDAVAIAEVPALLNLTNLAGMATTGSSVEIVFSTGRRITLTVQPVVHFPQVPELAVNQHFDVEDFYDFLDYFMDRVEQKQP